MSKIGKYEICVDIIFTLLLILLFGFDIYTRKYLLAFMVVQVMSGRYKGDSLLIWDEITLLIKSHVLYLIFCILIAPHTMYSFSYLFRLVCMTICSFLICTFFTRMLHIWLREQCKRKVLIFGIGDTADEIDTVVNGNRFTLMDIYGFVNCNNTHTIERVQEQKVDISKTIDFKQAISFIDVNQIDTVIFAIPELSKHELKFLMNMVEDKVQTVIYTPKLEGTATFNTKMTNFDGMVLVNSSVGPMDRLGAIIKRTIDIVAGLIGVLLLLPVTLFVMFYNKKCGDNGSIFFIQKRIGKNGKPFMMFKYRSMIEGAEKKLEELMKTDPAIKEEYMKNKKIVRDPRVTKAGDFIRKTSLDEFPQFINVLKGDMSLIGPRPYLPREKRDMGDYYDVVIKSKPGITGMWQTHGRNNLTFEDRLELDEYYYRNWNIWLDIQILVRTVKTVLMRSGVV